MSIDQTHGFEDETFDDDDFPSSPLTQPTIGQVIEARFGRRAILGGLAASLGAVAMGCTATSRVALAAGGSSTLGFAELPHGYDQKHHVAPGYSADVLIRWGDPVLPGAPVFNPAAPTIDGQRKQFGYNNDFLAFMPLPAGSQNAERGLLCVNHEYTNAELMFEGIDKKTKVDQITKVQAEIEMAAHGHTVIEIRKTGGKWGIVEGSRYARRISALDTEMRISGPAAGHDRLKTAADPTGTKVVGTLNNCAGGVTPWGTVMIAEENFHGYFAGDPAATSEARNYKRYGLKAENKRYAWHQYNGRFDVTETPNEPNRFGWMVEFDPYDPNAIPVKRTALGRFKHEGATSIVNKDGRVVVYSGDDQRFDYLYRFVSTATFNATDRAANADLLDEGTLSVAKFEPGGRMRWLPLVWNTGPLTPENGFQSQAEVMIETRRAADLLGATPMDRPEDVEPNPVSGRVYVMLTNNTKRKPGDENASNPRAPNKHGHVLELTPPGGRGRLADHAAAEFAWELPILCGDPSEPGDGARYHPATTKDGWLSAPDNCAFDPAGRLWITTDGAPKAGFADGIWAADMDGPGRALTRLFFAAPRGAEVCGPTFTPDGKTLFCAIQHPADEKGSTYAQPSTRWPDFDPNLPPRPSVIAITKDDGGMIGS